MNKAEYVKIIERALAGKVSSQELQDTVAYYRDYIDMEISKGNTEQEVLERLGDPRLLVKSIIAAKGHEAQNEAVNDREEQPGGVHISLPLIILAVLIILFIALGLILAVAQILLPILIPVAFVCLILSIINRSKK